MKLPTYPRLSIAALTLILAITGCSPELIRDKVKEGVAAQRAKRKRSEIPTRLEWRSKPEVPKAGLPALWSLKVLDLRNKEGEEPKGIRTYEAPHAVAMHLFIISNDLSQFAHMYPEPRDYGNFLVRPVIPQAGGYHLFVDYTPIDGFPIVQNQKFLVQPSEQGLPAGPAAKLAPTPAKNGWLEVTAPLRPDQSFVPTAGAPEFRVLLKALQTKVGENTLVARVLSADGAPVTNLIPHLGGAAYGIALSADGNRFVRLEASPRSATKPEETTFKGRFAGHGIYKLWLEFRLNENILVAPFVIEVGKPSASKSHP